MPVILLILHLFSDHSGFRWVLPTSHQIGGRDYHTPLDPLGAAVTSRTPKIKPQVSEY